jgi:ADAM cysteine-rich domain
MSLGRWLHHVRFAAHRTRFPLVTVQCVQFPSLFEVYLEKSRPKVLINVWISCSGDTASCLHNPPHEDEALGRSLPGTLLTLDAQCQRDRGTSACFKDERVCAQLFCFDAQSGYCVAYRPAAEGSSCGDGQV